VLLKKTSNGASLLVGTTLFQLSTMVSLICFYLYCRSTLQGFDIYKHMDLGGMKKLINCYTACMPLLHLRAVHFFCGRSTTLLSMALPAFKFIMGRQVRDRLIIHGGSRSDSNYTTDLKQYGLKLENLSTIIGGGFNNSDLNSLDAVEDFTGKV
jgi:hypothetical protein